MTTELAAARRPAPTASSAAALRHKVGNGLIWLFLCIIAAVCVGPVAFIFRASFGSGAEWTLDGWVKILQEGLLQAGLVSLTLGVLSCLLTTVIATMAAFAFAKLPFRGSQSLLMAIIIILLVPGQVFIIPQYLDVARTVGLGSIPMTAVIYSVSQLPFSIFVLTNFFRSIPSEIFEAAMVDGASVPRSVFSVFLPMAGPPLITVGVLNFIGVWNDLLIALLYLPSDQVRTIGVVLATAQSLRSFDVTMVLAGSLISAIPTMLIFLFFQRYITVGLTAGVGK